MPISSTLHSPQNGENDWPLHWDLRPLMRHGFPSLIFFLLLLVIYSNSFDCSWHFDDYANIVNNHHVHMQSLSWADLGKSIYGIVDSGRWSRPLSYGSFALNYYFNGLDVFGYHIVNFIVHYLATFFLYLFILNTLQLPTLSDALQKNASSIALLSAILWTVNPLQVGAVTYIVQRTTSMAALFYILAMYLYLKGRVAGKPHQRAAFFLLSFLAGMLAIGSKENAAMLPASMLLYEMMVIRRFTAANFKKSLLYFLAAAAITVALGFVFFKDFASIIGDYSTRPFTAWERLITEPRVILFYISLLLYPISSRLTLIHDFDVSKSLIDPWTTAASILIIAAILLLAVLKARKWPLIAYCLIFFFLNHAIEGSFLSLELVFEHRNYLPSMLLFVPVSLGCLELLKRDERRPALRYIVASALSFFIMMQGVTVYLQNMVWKDEITLWRDNAEKSPRVHHVRQNLGTAYFIAGRLPEAFAELNAALMSYASADITKKARTHGLLAEYYYIRGDLNQAMFHSFESLKLNPSIHQNYHRLAEILLQRNQSPDEAEMAIRKALALNGHVGAYHQTYAKILLEKDSLASARQEAKTALSLDPESAESYGILAAILKREGRDMAATHFRKIAATKGESGTSPRFQ